MKKIAIVIFAAALAACSAKVGNPAIARTESGISDQMETLATKSQVRAAFGAPNLSFEKDGVETYEYKTIRGNGRHHWLIPVVGWVMEWWQDDYSYGETNLFVRFDKKDNVSGFQVIKTGGTAR
ncbi:MAG: hypothetical protein LBL46_02345 [Rickettsiales bacterium]|jgi:hypothetical protein|nr:hypothetical protein [Rickettsiales bacterium]